MTWVRLKPGSPRSGVKHSTTEPVCLLLHPFNSVADNSGKVRIWDTVNKEHILKAEYPVLGGCVKDVSWDSQSQKLAVAGDGRER